MKLLCVYHKNCIDGFAAAWAVGQYFGFDNVEFHAADYSDAVPDLTNRTVYIVDFSWKPEKLLPAMQNAKWVYMVDHHDSAYEDWNDIKAPNFTLIYNKQRSGATLVWEYLLSHKPMPMLYKYLQDHDLWTHQINGTREVVAGLYGRGFIQRQDWKALEEFIVGPVSWAAIFDEGRAILQSNRNFIEGLLERNTRLVEFMGHVVPLANVPYEHCSIAGEILYNQGYPFAITYDDWLSKGIRKFSLRSKKVTGADVKYLARLLGGGGHPNAAGFSVPLHADMGTYLRFLDSSKSKGF